jgi:hypothetical protein
MKFVKWIKALFTPEPLLVTECCCCHIVAPTVCLPFTGSKRFCAKCVAEITKEEDHA